ncbi:extracellular solute-binding protein [Salarchaeum japonicum]|uniref:Tungstate ABC transporter substrate-binding protein WtpA n=1 Tax=Salarchaeum japonicum TaxID=555573 RepID=A0AAV3T399_9EURY|nr:extracellular solute-binding protein [Salarchaeum japonicum]
MGEQRSRRAVLAGAGASAAYALAGCLSAAGDTGDETDLTVFHAGSLSPPFAAAEDGFEAETGARVVREPKGSVASTKKVTRLGRRADALGVSDFRLLRDRLLPDDGDWYGIFATNAMAIQYTPDSTGADEISRENWWEVLSRDDVTVAHSDPAVDPGGYRAVMSIRLGAIPFRGSALYDAATRDAILDNTVVPTGTEAKLTAPLRSGKYDYVVYYRSLASTADLPWIALQPQVALSRATDEYAAHYAKATVDTDAGTFVGAPIAYGMTVPSVARSPELGARWVAYFATDPGRRALRDAGLEPVTPLAVPADSADAVPDRVLARASATDHLGPLSL